MRGGRMTKAMAGAVAGVLLAVAPSARGASGEVRSVGTYSFPLSGLSIDVGVRPRVLLWCQGISLLGVVLPDDANVECGSASQKRQLPRAFGLRDGRCEADGRTISFGFLVSRKAWLYGTTGKGPEERSALLLHRFEGSMQEGRLKGALVQVDVSHPGYAFQKKIVESEQLTSEQLSFPDEAAWQAGIAQSYCVSPAER